MTAREKPLHVQVAEALGWDVTHVWGRGSVGISPGSPRHERTPPAPEQIPWFDKDWAAGGPLLERFPRMELRHLREKEWSCSHWKADGSIHIDYQQQGETPLIAICRTIVVMHDKSLP